MRAVPIEELSRIWPTVEPWITDAVAYNAGDEGVLDVLIALARGVYQLWSADNCAAVTQLERRPKQSIWTICYAGGTDLDAAKQAMQFAARLAQQNGIEVIRIWGRPGWERVLGLKQVGVILQASTK